MRKFTCFWIYAILRIVVVFSLVEFSLKLDKLVEELVMLFGFSSKLEHLLILVLTAFKVAHLSWVYVFNLDFTLAPLDVLDRGITLFVLQNELWWQTTSRLPWNKGALMPSWIFHIWYLEVNACTCQVVHKRWGLVFRAPPRVHPILVLLEVAETLSILWQDE